MKVGDYVLATKYSDGSPRDHWCIGFYQGKLITNSGQETDRHMVDDGDGNMYRCNGFRRVMHISDPVARMILGSVKQIEESDKSMYWWKRYFQNMIKK